MIAIPNKVPVTPYELLSAADKHEGRIEGSKSAPTLLAAIEIRVDFPASDILNFSVHTACVSRSGISEAYVSHAPDIPSILCPSHHPSHHPSRLRGQVSTEIAFKTPIRNRLGIYLDNRRIIVVSWTGPAICQILTWEVRSREAPPLGASYKGLNHPRFTESLITGPKAHAGAYV